MAVFPFAPTYTVAKLFSKDDGEKINDSEEVLKNFKNFKQNSISFWKLMFIINKRAMWQNLKKFFDFKQKYWSYHTTEYRICTLHTNFSLISYNL